MHHPNSRPEVFPIPRALTAIAALALWLCPACAPPQAPEDTAEAAVPASRFQCHGEPFPCAALPPKQCAEAPGCQVTRACVGAPAACGELLLGTCETQRGCHWDLGCLGRPLPCSALESDAACAAQQGCRWAAETGRCEGEAHACETVGVTGCAQQRGCYVGGRCTGSALPCAEHTGRDCEGQQGCAVSHRCAGTALPCEAHLSAAGCAAVPGCRWEGPDAAHP